MDQYPSIEQVCKVAVGVFNAEAKSWRVRDGRNGLVVNETEVLKGRKAFGGISRIAGDCRAIAMHIIACHVPMHDAVNCRHVMLTYAQIGLHMGGVARISVWKLRKKACALLQRYEYQCMYYSALKTLVEQGFDMLALPKNLIIEKRA